MWYTCLPPGVKPGTEAHKEAQRQAEARAWAHVEQALRSTGDPAKVDSRFGTGELSGEGFYRRHGDPLAGYEFHVHPRKPNFREAGMVTWRPNKDTFH